MPSAEPAWATADRRARRPFVVLPATLGRYIATATITGVLVVIAAFAVLAFLIDLIEHLRSAAERDVGWWTAVELTALRLPSLLDRIWPFAVLFGAMLAFWRLNRAGELVAVRAAGVSAWQFLTPACLVAALLGVVVVTTLNPLTAALAARYERLEQRAFGGGEAQVAVFAAGIWLKQETAEERLVVSAERMRAGEPLRLEEVTVFVYDVAGDYVRRLDAASAVLADGRWELARTRLSDDTGLGQPIGAYTIPTDVGADAIRRSFRGPETLSFWELRDYIALLEELGFSAREHRVHWQSLLSLPLFFAAMLLTGVTFTLRFQRGGGGGRLLPIGLVGGFAFFILVDVVRALGVSGQLPPTMAAWTPTIVALMLGSAALFQLEDG